MSLIPPKLRASAFYRMYNPVPPTYAGLFDGAPLHFAPDVRMKLVPTDVLHGCIAMTGYYEWPLSQRVAEGGSGGGLLVDVGANVGYFTLLWAARGGRVIAFEASPRNLPLLRENVERNGLGDRVDVRGLAAGREDGFLEFDLGPDEQTGWGGFAAEKSEQTVRVDVVPLDTAVGGEQHIDLLKIDTEGADAWVLEGAQTLLREKRIGEIRFEEHKPRAAALGIKTGEVQQMLRDHGYEVRADSDPAKDQVDWVATPVGAAGS
ncbi:MAG: FkbM family methyltransferase [Planctomycetota bacterium]